MSEFIRPDFWGNSIINLMASIEQALGGDARYAPLEALPAADLHESSRVLLLLVDGLGYSYLTERHPDSRMAQHLTARLTTVFPSTTATAITAFHTGVPPQQHAITGWHTWLREYGSLAAILPFRPRHGGMPYSSSGIHAEEVLGASPLSIRLRVPSHVISPAHIVDSEFSRAAAGTAERHGYCNLDEFFSLIERELAPGSPSYVFAYWTDLDSLAHRHGAESAEVENHFKELDVAFGAFLDRMEGSGCTVLLSADHGFIDTTPLHVLELERHRALTEALVLPLCGEPRTAFCYLRPARVAQFRDYVTNELAHCCELREGEQLIEEGYFGLGEAHPRLQERVGDFALLMKDNWIVRDRLPHEHAHELKGVHGGSSAKEMFVPLVVARL